MIGSKKNFEDHPNLNQFIEKYCKKCANNCNVPSLEFLNCVFKKLNQKTGVNMNKKNLGD